MSARKKGKGIDPFECHEQLDSTDLAIVISVLSNKEELTDEERRILDYAFEQLYPNGV